MRLLDHMLSISSPSPSSTGPQLLKICQDGDRTNHCCFWKIWRKDCILPVSRTGRRCWQQCSNQKDGLARWRSCGRVETTFTYVSGHTSTCSFCCYLRLAFRCGLWPRLYRMQSAPGLQKDVINEKDLSKERQHRNYLRTLKAFTWKT